MATFLSLNFQILIYLVLMGKAAVLTIDVWEHVHIDSAMLSGLYQNFPAQPNVTGIA